MLAAVFVSTTMFVVFYDHDVHTSTLAALARFIGKLLNEARNITFIYIYDT